MDYLGFCGQSYQTTNSQFDATRTVNFFPEIDEAGTGREKRIQEMIRTPGKTLAVPFPPAGSGQSRGRYTTTTGRAFEVKGNQLFELTGNTPPFAETLVGTLLTSSGIVKFDDNGALVAIVDGTYGYQLTLSSTTLSQITDPNFLGGTFVCQYDGYFIFNVPNTNQFYWSNLNSLTFSALNTDYKDGNSDPIVSMAVIFRNLWLIGSDTTEIWYDIGQFPTILQRIPGPYIELGCAAPYTTEKTEFGLIWLSISKRNSVEVVMTPGDSYSINQIHTQVVAEKLQEYGEQISQATAFSYGQNGHFFYQINPYQTSPQVNTSSWVYDYHTSQYLQVPTWHERTFTDPYTGAMGRDLADNHQMFQGYHLIGDYTSPNVYYYDYANKTDSGFNVKRIRRGPVISDNNKRLFHSLFEPLLKLGLDSIPNIGNTQWSTGALESITSPAGGSGYGTNLPVVSEFGSGATINVTLSGFSISNTGTGYLVGQPIYFSPTLVSGQILSVTHDETGNCATVCWMRGVGPCAICNYQLFRSANGGPFINIGTFPSTQLCYDDVGLTNGVTYCYYVQVTDECGNVSTCNVSSCQQTPLYLTSRIYPIDVIEGLNLSALTLNSPSFQYEEGINLGGQFVSGTLDLTLYSYTNWTPEGINLSSNFVSGDLESVVVNYNNALPEGINLSAGFTSGDLENALLTYTYWVPEGINLSVAFIGGGLS